MKENDNVNLIATTTSIKKYSGTLNVLALAKLCELFI